MYPALYTSQPAFTLTIRFVCVCVYVLALDVAAQHCFERHPGYAGAGNACSFPSVRLLYVPVRAASGYVILWAVQARALLRPLPLFHVEQHAKWTVCSDRAVTLWTSA